MQRQIAFQRAEAPVHERAGFCQQPQPFLPVSQMLNRADALQIQPVVGIGRFDLRRLSVAGSLRERTRQNDRARLAVVQMIHDETGIIVAAQQQHIIGVAMRNQIIQSFSQG